MTSLLLLVKRNYGVVALTSVLCISLGMNVTLAERFRSSRAVHEAGIRVGAKIIGLAVEDPTGVLSSMRLDSGRRTVLYVFSPTCGWCKRNLNNIRALAQRQSTDLGFVGLSTTSNKLKEYLSATPMPFPVYAAKGGKLPKDIDLSSTPQMMVVDPKGVVEKVWQGALQGEHQAEAEKYFHIKLPGLS